MSFNKIREANALKGRTLLSGFQTSGTSLEKARSGVYADNEENRRLKRVGQPYGSKGEEDNSRTEPKGKTDDSKQTSTKSDPATTGSGKSKEEVTDKGKPTTNDSKKQNPTQQQNQENQISKHEIAQLTHLKSMIEQDPKGAYEIFQSLSPEAQDKVPQDVVNSLVKEAHSDTSNVEAKLSSLQELYDKHNEGASKARDEYNSNYESLLEESKKHYKDGNEEEYEKMQSKFSDLAKKYSEILNKLSDELSQGIRVLHTEKSDEKD